MLDAKQEEDVLMAYTTKQAAEKMGLSVYTLRYYDNFGLLKPAYIDETTKHFHQPLRCCQLNEPFHNSSALKIQ
jgi:hypothetical protein